MTNLSDLFALSADTATGRVFLVFLDDQGSNEESGRPIG